MKKRKILGVDISVGVRDKEYETPLVGSYVFVLSFPLLYCLIACFVGIPEYSALDLCIGGFYVLLSVLALLRYLIPIYTSKEDSIWRARANVLEQVILICMSPILIVSILIMKFFFFFFSRMFPSWKAMRDANRRINEKKGLI